MRNAWPFCGDLPVMLRAAVTAGLMLLLGFHAPQDHPTEPLHQPAHMVAPACDWDTEYHETLAELGEDEAAWRVAPLVPGRGGQTWMDERRVDIAPTVGCADVSSIIRHELVHLQQVRVYGSHQAVLAYYGSDEQLELAADCGALFLGATYSPYLGASPRCPAGLVRNALFLIAYNR